MITVSTIDFIKGMINTDSAWRYFHEVELMQYTGLKDKNGKEIYEGDIVEANSEYGDVIKDIVCWSYGSFYVANHTFKKLNNIEVIGNIYQHSHLLEVT